MAKRKRQDEQSAVVDMEVRRKEDIERKARLFAEACAKDDPSPDARAMIDAELDADPEAWRRRGDLGAEAFDLAFKKFWLGYYTKSAVRKGAELLKQQMGYEEASATERVLIDHAVLCHVRLGMIEHLYSRNTSGRLDITEHYEKRLTLAQRRFTRAVETLARVRALLARAEVAREQARKATGPQRLRQVG